MFARERVTRSTIAWAILSVPGGTLRAAAAQHGDTLPRPPGVRVVSLPREPGNRPNETSVAVNPRDPRQLIASYQRPVTAAGVTRFGVSVAWSADGGEKWTVSSGAAPQNYNSADPSVAFDLHGRAFVAYVAFDKFDNPGLIPYWAKSGVSRAGAFVRRSVDGGRTWEASHTALIEYPAMPDAPLEDKPYIVADNQASSPHAGNLYVGWTRYSLEKSEILFSRSTDGGRTWSRPLVISTDPGLPRGAASGAVHGFYAAVGRDGTVYAVWSDGQAIVLVVSHDGGGHFEPSRRVMSTTFWAARVTGFESTWAFPAIAIDPRAGPPGRLFLSWADYRYGDMDVLASTSDDGGRTWTPPVRVNDDPKHNGKDQVMSWLAVDPADGAAYAIFQDRRGDPKNGLTTVTLARSTDGGRSFTNYAWSATPSDPRQARLGDYIGVAALDGRVYGVWTENVPGELKGDDATVLRLTGSFMGPSVIRVGVADFRTTRRTAGKDAPRR